MNLTAVTHGVILVIFLLVYSGLNAQYSVSRVEPPNWWAGMKNHEVQLMIYGVSIADLMPETTFPGVEIMAAHRSENRNYLFIDLAVSPEAVPGTIRIQLKKEGGIKAGFDFTLFPRTAGSAAREGFGPSDVVYLITPDRFSDGNPGNNTVVGYTDIFDRKNPEGRHGGDLRGIINSLDYIREMGLTSIWLNPVLENNMQRTSYHGYAITDFYKVDPRFGSNEEYRELVDAAGKKGIGVIMDMVFNHCGSNHWWMNDLPSADWLNLPGSKEWSNHRRTTIRDPYASVRDRDLFSDGWFVDAMPDLNQRNPFLARYLIQNTIWWIEFSGINGIRVDTYCYPDPGFMSHWSASVLDEYPGFSMVGEEWSENPAVVSYWQLNKKNPDGYKSYMNSMMDFPLHANLIKALTEPENSYSSGWIKLYEMLSNDFLYPDPSQLMIFPDNHDMNRYYTQLHNDLDLYKTGLVFTMTINRIPQLFYGTEILMTSPAERNDGLIRSDYPGGWPGDTINAFTGYGLNDQQLEAKEFTKKLLNWRKSSVCIHKGKLIHFAPENGMYVYFRYIEEKGVMVILNKNKAETTLDRIRFEERLGSATSGLDILTGNVVDFNHFTVPSGSPMIIEFTR